MTQSMRLKAPRLRRSRQFRFGRQALHQELHGTRGQGPAALPAGEDVTRLATADPAAERVDQLLRQRNDAVLVVLGLVHKQRAPLEIEVFDAEIAGLPVAQTAVAE